VNDLQDTKSSWGSLKITPISFSLFGMIDLNHLHKESNPSSNWIFGCSHYPFLNQEYQPNVISTSLAAWVKKGFNCFFS
jgi:hypothetical protein